MIVLVHCRLLKVCLLLDSIIILPEYITGKLVCHHISGHNFWDMHNTYLGHRKNPINSLNNNISLNYHWKLCVTKWNKAFWDFRYLWDIIFGTCTAYIWDIGKTQWIHLEKKSLYQLAFHVCHMCHVCHIVCVTKINKAFLDFW